MGDDWNTNVKGVLNYQLLSIEEVEDVVYAPEIWSLFVQRVFVSGQESLNISSGVNSIKIHGLKIVFRLLRTYEPVSNEFTVINLG